MSAASEQPMTARQAAIVCVHANRFVFFLLRAADAASFSVSHCQSSPISKAACLAGKHKVVQKLFAAGANWRIGERDGYTCMHGAAFQGVSVCLMPLVTCAAILIATITCTHCNCCECLACWAFLIGLLLAGRSKVAEAAIKAGVPASDKHPDGYLPIHRACWGRSKHHAQTVRVLVRKGGEDVNALSDDGLTPLLVAAGSEQLNLHVLEALVDLGADLSAKDATGETAMHKVIQGGMMDEDRKAAIALLVKGGVDLTTGSDDGDLRHLAWQFGYGSVVDEALAEVSTRPPHPYPQQPQPATSQRIPPQSAAIAAAEAAARAAAAAAGVAPDIQLEF
jgi:hypothetical protein